MGCTCIKRHENYIDEKDAIVGYKLVNMDMTPRHGNIVYEVGPVYSIVRDTFGKSYIQCGTHGLHMCKRIIDCYKYYGFDSRLFRVKGWGEYDVSNDKYAFEHIQFLEELMPCDVLHEGYGEEIYGHAYHLRQISSSDLVSRIRELDENVDALTFGMTDLDDDDFVNIYIDEGIEGLSCVLRHTLFSFARTAEILRACANVYDDEESQMNAYKEGLSIMKRVTDHYSKFSLFCAIIEECSDDEWIDYIKGVKDNTIYILFRDMTRIPEDV